MLVGQSTWELILVRGTIFLFQYLGAGCLGYFFVALVAAGVDGIKHPFSIFVEVVGLIEITFYVAWYLPYKSYLQRPGIQSEPLSRSERRQLYRKGLDNSPDLEKYLRTWHGKAQMGDIRRENMKDWLMWAIFQRQGNPGPNNAELEEYIVEAEELLGTKIKGGFGDAKPIRISFDPVVITHRSLLFYMMVGFFDFLTTMVLLTKGFEFYRQPRATFLKTFPFRPMTILSGNESASPDISYFYRPHKSSTLRPILFVHGVGVGLLPYLLWIHSIPSDVGVLAIEILPVSSRICAPLPSTPQLISGVNAILNQQKMTDFVFVGNSFGTLLISPMLQHPEIAPCINSVVLIDPVSLLLHLPDVAYNFTRRKPKYANEWELWYVATDPGIAHTLARRFCWYEFILWTSQLEGRRTTVVLGGKDCVTNPDAVASYVYFGDLNCTRDDVLEWRTTPDRWSGMAELELMYLEGKDHGQAFLSPAGMPQIANVIQMYTQRDKELDSRLSRISKSREMV